MQALGGDRTFISRLRVRAAVDSTERSNLCIAFAAASLAPGGLSPSTIVCIRRLSDPRPGTLRPSQIALQLPRHWVEAARSAIGDQLRRASTPVRGHLPDDAECVVFADEAEALACLAMDWCEHRVSSRWWWKTLFKSPVDIRAVIQRFFESVEYVPAAMEYLAVHKAVVRFVQRLAPADAQSLLAQVAFKFGLRQLQPVVSGHGKPPSPVNDFPGSRESAGLRDSNDRAGRQAAPVRLDAPWSAWAPEADDPSLLPQQRALLGTVLVLRRAPTVARSKAFADRMQFWNTRVAPEPRAVLSLAASQSQKRRTAPTVSGDVERHSRVAEAGTQSSDAHDAPGPRRSGPIEDGELQPTTPVRRFSEAAAAPFAPLDTAAPVEVKKTHAGEQTPATVGCNTPGAVDANHSAAEGVREKDCSSLPQALPTETEFGGVFYLLNVGISLGYYADFASNPDSDLPIPIWDFAALVGRELVGPPLEQDPVWGLLAQLSSREPSDSLVWPGNTPANLLTRVRARLAAALGLSDPVALGTLVCRHRARVFVTSTHVDVMLSLASLPIEIRVSGLDRNPAWIPSAGRFVTFHFD